MCVSLSVCVCRDGSISMKTHYCRVCCSKQSPPPICARHRWVPLQTLKLSVDICAIRSPSPSNRASPLPAALRHMKGRLSCGGRAERGGSGAPSYNGGLPVAACPLIPHRLAACVARRPLITGSHRPSPRQPAPSHCSGRHAPTPPLFVLLTFISTDFFSSFLFFLGEISTLRSPKSGYALHVTHGVLC